jgi:hypothetical protein
MVRQLIKAVPICGNLELHNSAMLYSVLSLFNPIQNLMSLTLILYYPTAYAELLREFFQLNNT